MLNLLVSAALGIALFGYLPGVDAVAGVTTFNDYTTQSGVACAGFSPVNSQGGGIFSAAMADLSPLWVGSRCTGSMNAANCCPATHPAFGGTIPNDEACEASGTNALDIATTARSALSSFEGNLRIDIESTSC
ncbi:hypothetical protein K438DRAFT_1907697 [Mycena galopus ATCC 62051]|nr:hypothetical protein K438DRAFT_1907697 [Mycena galopus ATCC 62051]